MTKDEPPAGTQPTGAAGATATAPAPAGATTAAGGTKENIQNAPSKGTEAGEDDDKEEEEQVKDEVDKILQKAEAARKEAAAKASTQKECG